MHTEKDTSFVHLSGDGLSDLPERVHRLGQALLHNCPMNDCLTYRYTFKVCLGLDHAAGRTSGGERELLLKNFLREYRKLKYMFFNNRDVISYRRRLDQETASY